MGIFKKKKVVFFIHCEGSRKRFDRRAVIEVHNEKTLAEDFYEWIVKQLKEIKQQDEDAVIVNMNIIR